MTADINRKKLGIVAACALVAVVTLYFTVFRPSEEDRVRWTVERFVKSVAVKQDENPLARMGRLKGAAKETTTDDIFVSVPDYNVRISDRIALVDNAGKIGLLYQTAECDLTGITVKIDEAATTAKVDATAIVTGSVSGEKRVDKRGIHFLLRKDGDWKITSIDVASANP